MSVRDDKIKEYAGWMAEILTNQFAETLIYENYGETSERPCVEVDTSRPLEASEKATLLTAISNATLPLPVEQTYKLLGFTVPQDGQKALVNGAHIIMEPAVTQTEAKQQQADMEIATAKAMNPPEKPVKASFKDTVKQASAKDLAELKELMIKAKKALHLNGEWERVQVKIKSMRIV